MVSQETEQWLQGLPLGEPIDIGGESVCLLVDDDGAELVLVLLREPSQVQIAEAMRSGFQCALEFDGGLAIAEDSGALLLNRWLAQAESWVDAAEALEDLLNQASLCRAAMKPSPARPAQESNRAELRMRAALNGGTS
ncbi:hypothetical protein J8I26_04245 [Herbaspirillum sp. LeCh32-8]|uniref:hypothetical protein n=1 Tax=Herbaspirillum sp. LeCh32-8 TaxID=2821356 RepID=UPI001AE62A86|nr:hypothetical protein [Herbaspirillum sp. LeCh32-8]MBP0597301.1 hypothetical protein [Herbaspirillum sp. LeCh32-8]